MGEIGVPNRPETYAGAATTTNDGARARDAVPPTPPPQARPPATGPARGRSIPLIGGRRRKSPDEVSRADSPVAQIGKNNVAQNRVSAELGDEFHTAVNNDSRELEKLLRTQAAHEETE